MGDHSVNAIVLVLGALAPFAPFIAQIVVELIRHRKGRRRVR
jgi:hypothetical protein